MQSPSSNQTAELADAVRRETPEAVRGDLIVVYDGACPFCSAFSDYVALRDRYKIIRQLDARSVPALVAQMRATGVDLDRDFAIVRDDDVFAGVAGMRALSDVEFTSRRFGWVLRRSFGRQGSGVGLYRALNLARRALLRLLGRPGL